MTHLASHPILLISSLILMTDSSAIWIIFLSNKIYPVVAFSFLYFIFYHNFKILFPCSNFSCISQHIQIVHFPGVPWTGWLPYGSLLPLRSFPGSTSGPSIPDPWVYSSLVSWLFSFGIVSILLQICRIVFFNIFRFRIKIEFHSLPLHLFSIYFLTFAVITYIIHKIREGHIFLPPASISCWWLSFYHHM